MIPANPSTYKKILSALSVAFIMILLFLPVFQMTFKILPDRKTTDNRQLAKKPRFSEWNLQAIAKYTKEFETFFNDNFGFRNSLIHLHATLLYDFFKETPVPHVIIGRDGWLFHSSGLSDFFGTTQFSPAELKSIEAKIAKLQGEFKKRKIDFIVILAPDKHTIYPEKLPDELIKKRSHKTRADQLDELLTGMGIKFIDLRIELKARKLGSPGPLYYLTDTHWNNLGAFYGYKKINDAIRKEYPAIPSRSLDDFKIELKDNLSEGDLATMISMDGNIKDSFVNFYPKVAPKARKVKSDYADMSIIFEIPNNKLPVLVAFRDSFSTALVPFMSEDFSRSVFLWQHNVDLSIIDKEKPDIVILEFVERFSSNLK